MSGILRNKLPVASVFNLWILIFAITIQPNNLAQAQISSFKMGDTLFLKPKDEFLDVRLSKFSAVQVGQRPFFRTLVYFDGKPFTGTIIKRKGLSMSGREIIGSFAQYSENEDDQTTFSITYLNGRFFGRYFEENDETIVNFWFDKNGDPDNTGEVIIKNPAPRYFEYVPSPYPKFIRISDRLLNGNYFVEFYGNSDLGVFNHRGNTESVSLLPAGFQSINEIIYEYAVANPQFIDCTPKDTMLYFFSQNHLKSYSFKDNCNSKVVFEKPEMIMEMPLFGAATNYGNDFAEINYSHLLFQSSFSNLLTGSQDYYIDQFLSNGSGYFFASLDKLPTRAQITRENYRLELQFDIEKVKRSAKQVPLNELLATPKSHGPYHDPIYQISIPLKSFEINCDILDQTNMVKHLQSSYTLSSTDHYELTSEYQYNGDTINIKTLGDIKNNILEKFELQMNPNTIPTNGQIRWLSIVYKGNGKYLIEVAGRLGWDRDKKTQITSCQLSAKIKNYPASGKSFLDLQSDGISTFIYEDGTQKQFTYKDGKLIID